MTPGTLTRMLRLRERARDLAGGQLARARAAQAQFEERIHGWRGRMGSEAQLMNDGGTAYLRWVDANRRREAEALEERARLAAEVAAAEEVFRAADRAVEQIEALAAQAAVVLKRQAQAREQRRLDDWRRPPLHRRP